MIDRIPAWAWSSFPDGSTEFLNQSWQLYTGLPVEEGLGWGWNAHIHPDDLKRLLESWTRVLASGEPGEEEARLRRFDGEYRWFLFRAVPIRDDHGTIVRWYGTNTDIEDLKRAESLLGIENLILGMIGGGSGLSEILEALCERVDAQAANVTSTILLAAPDGNQLRFAAGRRVSDKWVQAITTMANCSSGRACGPRHLAVTELSAAPICANCRRIVLGNNIRGAWCQTILVQADRILGAFCILRSGSRISTPTDMEFVERLARVALVVIERERFRDTLTNTLNDLKRSEDQLLREKAELRQIVDLIPQIIIVIDPTGFPLYANKVALDYMGVEASELPTVGFGGRMSHPDDVEQYREIRRDSLVRGVPFKLEQRILGKDGRYRWFLIHYSPLKDDGGRVLRWYVTATDIDARRLSEDRTKNENFALRDESARTSMVDEIVGSSRSLCVVLDHIEKVAPTDSTVLILGETGTGKELIAHAIHRRSSRSAEAFIRVNCAAIPPALVASELFGHERGAFTGALQRRLGRFESADGGTIFLDEIGELPMETQVALLRVLQEGEFERVGSSKTCSVDVRVLTATNRDLNRAVAEGAFRMDLFYRLNVFPIRIPALRVRRDDIPALVERFIDRYSTKTGKRIRKVSRKTLDILMAYEWPGNIRELQNIVERAVVLSDGETFVVDEAWLRRETSELPGPTLPLANALGQREKMLIETALAECRGRIAGAGGAAAKLGVPRQTLESRIAKLGIRPHEFKAAKSVL